MSSKFLSISHLLRPGIYAHQALVGICAGELPARSFKDIVHCNINVKAHFRSATCLRIGHLSAGRRGNRLTLWQRRFPYRDERQSAGPSVDFGRATTGNVGAAFGAPRVGREVIMLRGVRPADGLRFGLCSLAAVIALVSIGTDPADARGRRKRHSGHHARVAAYNAPYAAIVVDANS